MMTMLCDANKARKHKIERNQLFTESEVQSYVSQYDAILETGIKQNKTCVGKYAKKDEKKLLNRLQKYKENHLLFIKDFAVPFENNMSERDLRKCKNRQKMSGGFCKSEGHQMYCKILSVIETCKRKNMGVFQNIIKILDGSPAIF